MTKQVARYAVTFGLSGCYMPDSHDGSHEFSRRKDLAEFIKDELVTYEMPASLFDEVNIRRLWGFIQQWGSSQANFSLHHKQFALEFHGLTENEYKESEEE